MTKTKNNFLKNIRAFILDMDGVLWRENQPIGHLPTIFDKLELSGVTPILATNNSTRTINEYVDRIDSFGVHLEPWQVVTSSQATADLLTKLFPNGGNVYVVGEPALESTLQEAGFRITDQEVVAVVAGMDRYVNYTKLRTATMLIRSGARFIASNPDRTFPTPEGLAPGAGAVIAAIQAATDIEPLIAGKPQPGMYQIALDRLNVTPEETLVVGDRPETDILGGQKLGCRTALVLSGVADRLTAESWIPNPDLIAEDLTEVVDSLFNQKT